MSMIIPEFGTLQMTRASEQHFGQGKVQSVNGEAGSVNSLRGLNNSSGAVKNVSGQKASVILLSMEELSQTSLH